MTQAFGQLGLLSGLPDPDGERRRIDAATAEDLLHGARSFRRVGGTVSAVQLAKPTSVALGTGDVVTGQAGDWLVEGEVGRRIVSDFADHCQSYMPVARYEAGA